MSAAAPLRILLVDDEAGSAVVAKELLVALNASPEPAPEVAIVSTPSAADALRHLLRGEFALIVLSGGAAQTGAWELVALIRQRERSRQIPVILVGLVGDLPPLPREAIEWGPVAQLARPAAAADLRAALARLWAGESAPAGVTAGQVGADLESIVRERTTSLIKVNERLRHEIARRERAETEVHEARLEAETANRAKSDFLANMSHEIRTPLNGIVGMTALALQTGLTAEQREYLSLTKTSADALLTVINDILDFSKIEAGCLDVESIVFALDDCVGESVKTLALSAQQKGLELAWEIAPEVPEGLIGDPVRLRQILINLTANAVKFTERGHVLVAVESVAAASGGVECHFSVKDSGIGISSARVKKLFAPFQQGDSSTTRLYGGTGLGLSISARLVELMGGRIWVDSEPGHGCTFHFSLPFGRSDGGRPASVPCAGNAPRRIRALVVEGRDVTRGAQVKLLQRWPAEVDAAADAATALALIAAARRAGGAHDLVLLAENLPDADRRALAATLCGGGDGVTVPTVLVVRAIGQRESCAAEADAAAVRYLTAPLSRADLRAVVAVSPAPTPVSDGLPTATGSGPAHALNILLVDDHPINRRVAQQVLAKAGHHVIAAESGAMAVALLEGSPATSFDLVLMDVQMPGMDGIEATGLIRAGECAAGRRRVPIIALTAHALTKDCERCLSAGMDAYLVKPIQPADLLAAVARIDTTPPRAAPVIDCDALLERLGQDRQLLAEITAMFLDSGLALMTKAREALHRRAAGPFGQAVHTLVGMLRNLAADGAAAVAGRLEAEVGTVEWSQLDAGFALLEREVERFSDELVKLSGADKA